MFLGRESRYDISREHVDIMDTLSQFNGYAWGNLAYQLTIEEMRKDFSVVVCIKAGCRDSESPK